MVDRIPPRVESAESTSSAAEEPSLTSLMNSTAANPTDHPTANEAPAEANPAPPFDFGSLLEGARVHWRWVVITGGAGLLLGLVAAALILRPTYTAAVQLTRYEPPLAADAFKPQPPSMAALFGMISSSDAMQHAGATMVPARSADQLASHLQLTMDRASELITVAATGRTAAEAVTLANRFSAATVQSTQATQQAQAAEGGRQLALQLANNEADRAKVRGQLASIESLRATARQKEQVRQLASSGPTVAKVDSAKLSRLEEKTQAARDTLADLMTRYTEVHPLVREQKARLDVLEAELLRSVRSNPPVDAALAASLPADGGTAVDQSTGYDALALSLSTLENSHADLVARQRAMEFYAAHPPGDLRVLHAATPDNVSAQRNRLVIGTLAALCGALGALAAGLVIMVRELLDSRLKTGADLRRVTRLPLLASLGDLDAMSPAQRANWAFRTWTALQHRLSGSANHGLVCGFTSSGHGEGRSTWIELLAQAARQCGFRVLTISSPAGQAAAAPSAAARAGLALVPVESQTFASMVSSTPAQLVEILTLPDPVAKIDLPYPGGWARNLQNRREWESALSAWRTIESIVIFVELPPVTDPEAVLLAQSLPNLVWLAESHKAGADETLQQLETLRHGRCHLVGAVLNRERASALTRRFSRWFGHRTTIIASLAGLAGSPASAQLPPNPDAAPAAPPAAFAVIEPAQRAAWQQRFTLGPGDLLNLSLFGQPELTQLQVPVGPDGRVSYLEAENVAAAGLTVDEFRVALNTALAQFRRSPEVVVTPAGYHSKKIYVMGSVVKKGAFTLDRPMTVIEALSLAQGFIPVPADRNQAVSADLTQSFLSRHGTRVPVDFSKLFLEGDLSQNIALEPGDYLYFPPGDPVEVYVLGEVRFPGPAPFTPHSTSMEAIAVRGGFSDRAWQGRLLVIRGTLDHPQVFVVNAHDVLAAKTGDFELQPHDIIYVNSRPWIRGEDLLDIAVSAFLQSAVVTATGRYIYNSTTLPTTTP